MHPQTKTQQQPSEFIYMPSMHLWIAWKKGGTSKLYSYELRNTLKQIVYRDEKPRIDLEYGFQRLVHLVENVHRGKFNSARIYGNSSQTQTKDTLLQEYNSEGKITVLRSFDFAEEKYKNLEQTLIDRLINNIRKHSIIINPVTKETLIKR